MRRTIIAGVGVLLLVATLSGLPTRRDSRSPTKTTVIAEVASYLRGVERTSGNSIRFSAEDMAEAANLRAVISLLRP
jgi:D-aminopeptidase